MVSQNISSLWGHLHWLSVLAQQGSYTAAAARLGVSKAAMSIRIAELERAARIPLVHRTTRSVRLTEAGQRLVDDTRTSFEKIAQTFDQVRDLADQPSGLLRVTAPVALARQQLMPLLTEFLRLHPQVRIELDMTDRLRSLATEGYDLAIRHTERAPDTHVAWKICNSESLLVASKAYLRRAGIPKAPSDLQHHNCLHYPRAHEQPIWSFMPQIRHKSREVITIPVQGSLTANNSEALRESALVGAGVALLPDFTAYDAISRGQLVRVLPDWRVDGGFGRHIFALRPYSPHVPRAVSSLVSYLREKLAQGFSIS